MAAVKALLVKMSSLGDVVHALPAVTEAGRRGVRFDWVVEGAYSAIAEAHPAVDRVLPIAWRRWRRRLWQSRRPLREFFGNLAETHYDLALDAQGLLKSALLLNRARSSEKTGFSRQCVRERPAAWFYQRGISVSLSLHAADRQRQLFAAAFRYPDDASQALDFGLTRASRRSEQPLCIFLHGSAWPSKLWPEPFWRELAKLAAEAGFLTRIGWGTASEHERAQRIVRAGACRLLPALDVAGWIEALASAWIVIGVDSGLTHLAAALDVPVLALHGSTASALTGPRGKQAQALAADFACAPCQRRRCGYRGQAPQWRGNALSPACYADLPPERVWRQAQALLQGLPHVPA